MKKAFLLILSVFVSIGFFLAKPAFAQENSLGGEKIELFEIDLTLQENTDIIIHERIHYYMPVEKHGIYRVIPINKRNKSNILKSSTKVNVNSVAYYPTDNPNATLSTYEVEDYSDEVFIKIGRGDRFVQGHYTYEISYVVKNGINYFEDHDELYWNLIGTGWEVPIERVSAKIHLPGEVVQSVCYTGIYESTEQNCEIINQTEKDISLTTTTVLNPNEPVTIAVGMPKGSIEDVKKKEEMRMLRDILIGISPLALIPIFFLFVRKLKSPKKIIVPSFKAPKNLNLIMAGNLLSKGKINQKAITAEMINLAIQGNLRVEQNGKKEYTLHKISPSLKTPFLSSEALFTTLFLGSDTRFIGEKHASIAWDVPSIWDKSKNDLELNNYIDDVKSSKVKIIAFLPFLFLFLAFLVVGPLADSNNFIGIIVLIITGIALFSLASMSDTRNKEGNDLYYELLGLKMYIETAEKHRIEFHNNPEKFKGVFESLLPYAILFGLEKKWMKEFEDLYTTPPEWYQGDDFSTFNPMYVTTSMVGTNEMVSSGSGSSTGGGFSSGGSGFSGGSSGGGGGGGGGGSW